MNKNQKMLKDVFNEETSESLLDELVGGKWDALTCAMLWLSCQQNQVYPCGTTTSSCDVWAKNCK